MEIFPAIDIRGGQVVRLAQGDYSREVVYASEPAQVAVEFRQKGAKHLHMVDLDGARDGAPANFDAIKRTVAQGGLAVQIGGGIRDESTISKYMEIGVARVILGTVALENIAFTSRMVALYGDRIAVGVDAREGRVAVRGWREVSRVDAIDFCKKLEQAGVSTIIYTDISKDGMGIGTNMEAYRNLTGQINCNIIASGGISFVDELKELSALGVYGAILGKALYTRSITLEEALKTC